MFYFLELGLLTNGTLRCLNLLGRVARLVWGCSCDLSINDVGLEDFADVQTEEDRAVVPEVREETETAETTNGAVTGKIENEFVNFCQDFLFSL